MYPSTAEAVPLPLGKGGSHSRRALFKFCNISRTIRESSLQHTNKLLRYPRPRLLRRGVAKRRRGPFMNPPQAPKFCRRANHHCPKDSIILRSDPSFAARQPSFNSAAGTFFIIYSLFFIICHCAASLVPVLCTLTLLTLTVNLYKKPTHLR